MRDLEFIQFHPTALMLPGAPHFLISEAVRGEGARLIDDQGDSPVSQLSGADLAPRDAVSRALVQRMRERQTPHLWLDLRPVGSSKLEQQFPTILGRCRELGLEPTQAPIPVAPAAHYCMGGVRTDGHSATTIPGLYAVGEVASSGVHGANRLASNSLMECLVYARQLREIELAPAGPTRGEPTLTALSASEPSSGLETIARQTEQLRQLCWQVAGVERDGHALLAGYRACRQLEGELSGQPLLQALESLDKDRAVELPEDQARWLGKAHDLQQRATVAALLMESALFRAESRGGHFRVDVPAQQPFWRRHSLQRQGLSISTEALAD